MKTRLYILKYASAFHLRTVDVLRIIDKQQYNANDCTRYKRDRTVSHRYAVFVNTFPFKVVVQRRHKEYTFSVRQFEVYDVTIAKDANPPPSASAPVSPIKTFAGYPL